MQTSRRARPTRADVAQLANVSTATVTYVLNNVTNQTISPGTREAVRVAAETLGYRPNLSARNLASGASGIILYVVPRMALGELPIEVGSLLTSELAKRGIVLSLQFDTDDGATVVDAINDLHPIAIASVFPLAGPAREAARTHEIPEIHLGSENLYSLGSLNLTVGTLQVDYLHIRGHRRLAFARSDNALLAPLGDFWFAGLADAAAQMQLPPITHRTVMMDGTNSAALVREWVENGITAVCTQNDDVAFALLQGMRWAGVRCPQDLAVIGVDATPLGRFTDPPLTSVEFDAHNIVQIAVSAMVDTLGLTPNPITDTTPSSVTAAIVERESV